MIKRFFLACVFMSVFGFGANPSSGATVEGQVIDRSGGAGLSDVEIVVSASGSSWKIPERTTADGVFRIDLSAGFTLKDLETEVIYLEFRKEKYTPLVRMWRASHKGRIEIRGLKVKMEAIGRPAGSGSTASRSTAPERDSAPGKLYLLPYRIYGGDTAEAEAVRLINERLPFHLKRGIITHIQTLQVSNPPSDVTLDVLPSGVDGADHEKVREFGIENDALAVIRGEGELTSNNGHALELTSEFLILPSLPDFRAGSLYVDDHISRKDMGPARLSGSLRETWGTNTVLAIALQEAQDAFQETDPIPRHERLQRARSYLVAEKRRAGAGSDILVRQIDNLLAIVEREIAK